MAHCHGRQERKILALLELDHCHERFFQWIWDYVRNALKISLPMAAQSVLMSMRR